MAGEGADNLIGYLKCVHLNSICGALSTTLATLEAICREYYSKYIAKVSDKCDETINTDELEEIQRALKDIRYRVYQVESDMKAIMHSISGATKQSYRGLGTEIPIEFEKAIKQLGDLVNTIGEIETASTSELDGIEASISAIRQIIYASCSKDASITAFSPNEFFGSQEFSALFTAMETISAQYTNIQSRSEEIDGLLAGVEKQWKQRETIATVTKIGFAIIETVVIATAVVMPPLSIVGTVCIGVAAGTINGAVSAGLEQWASGEKAIRGGFDFHVIGYESAKGGFMGGLKAGIGYTVAPIKSGLSGVSKWALDSSTNIIENFAASPLEFIDTIVEEEDFDNAWDRITSKEYARETVVKSVVSAGVDNATETLMGNVTDKIPESRSAIVRYGKKFISDGLENVISNTGEEITDSAIDAFIPDDETDAAEQKMSYIEQLQSVGHRIGNEAIPAAIDEFVGVIEKPCKLVNRFVAGGIEGVSVEVFEESDTYHNRVNRALQTDGRLQGVSGPKYSSYTQSYTGEHIAFDNSQEPIEVLLLDSDPDLAVMKEIASDYSSPMKTGSKAASKLWIHETYGEEQELIDHFVGFDFSMRPIVQP